MNLKHRILAIGGLLAGASLGLAALIAPASAGGPNLVTNGDFPANVNGWSDVSGAFGSLTWSAGHAVVTDTIFTGSGSSAGAWQCLGPAAASDLFDLEADTFVPLNQARGGHVEAQLLFYPQAGCSGSELGRVLSQQRSPAANWQHVSGSGKAFANTQSVGVYLWVSKHSLQYGGGQPGDVFAAWFDNVSVTKLDPPTPTPTNPPPPQGSPIPTKSPTGSPTPAQTVIAVTTPVIPMLTPAPENTPIVTIPGGDWPPVTTPPPATATAKATTTPSNTPATTPPPTREVPQQPQTTPSLPEQHTSEPSQPEAPATPLPPSTGSGTNSGSSHSSVAAAGLVLMLVSGASLAGARRRKR